MILLDKQQGGRAYVYILRWGKIRSEEVSLVQKGSMFKMLLQLVVAKTKCVLPSFSNESAS